jgi:adenylyltransferase/sulfurtransferase
MTANDYRLIQLRYSCPLLRREDVQAGRVPTAPTIASMIGAWQVQELLKLIHGLPIDTGTALVFNGLTNHSYKSKLPRRDDCLSHEHYSQVRASPFTRQSSVGEVLAWGRGEMGGAVTLVLDRDWVEALVCDHCQQRQTVGRTAGLVTQSEALCRCGQVMRPIMRCEVDAATGLDAWTLAQLGVPDWDIVKLMGPGGDELHVALQAEEAFAAAGNPLTADARTAAGNQDGSADRPALPRPDEPLDLAERSG